MNESDQPSVLRSLAVALGAGVGLGMKLTDAVAGQVLPAEANQPPLAERVGKIERRLESLDHPVVIPPGDESVDQRLITGIMAALDARLSDFDSKLDRRFAETSAAIATDIEGLNRRAVKSEESASAVRAYVDDKIAGLRGQVVAINHEFAQAVAGIVREEVARHVDARIASLDGVLQERMSQLVEAALQQVVERLRPSAPPAPEPVE
jgi:hypothetical protein